jgi:PAS domain-containing protein
MEVDASDHLRHAEQFARGLTTPVFIVDPEGNVLYYNEVAGNILGRNFADTGPISASAWTRIFSPTDEEGYPLLPDSLPLMIALNQLKPNHGTMWIQGIDNVRRHIGVTAFPIMERDGAAIGAMAIYWEIEEGTVAGS